MGAAAPEAQVHPEAPAVSNPSRSDASDDPSNGPSDDPSSEASDDPSGASRDDGPAELEADAPVEVRVGRLVAGLEGIDQLPLAEHAPRYADVHAQLQGALTEIDGESGG
jgi:hypothetical protein